MNTGLARPMSKVLYAPIRTQNKAQQTQRSAQIDARRAASSVRPEKSRGLRR